MKHERHNRRYRYRKKSSFGPICQGEDHEDREIRITAYSNGSKKVIHGLLGA